MVPIILVCRAQGTVVLSSASGSKPRITIGGVNAGLFSKGTLVVSGKLPGETVSVTIRGWDKDTGFSKQNHFQIED